jgi:hypothetical protein
MHSSTLAHPVIPSPSKPTAQLQKKLPSLFAQVASARHGDAKIQHYNESKVKYRNLRFELQQARTIVQEHKILNF